MYVGTRSVYQDLKARGWSQHKAGGHRTRGSWGKASGGLNGESCLYLGPLRAERSLRSPQAPPPRPGPHTMADRVPWESWRT